MTPPNKNIATAHMHRRKPLLIFIDGHRFYRKARQVLEVVGDLVSQKIIVCFFLLRLALIPYHDINKFWIGCSNRNRKKQSCGRCLNEFSTGIVHSHVIVLFESCKVSTIINPIPHFCIKNFFVR